MPRKLTKDLAELAMLQWFSGKPYSAIAKDLNLSDNALRKRASREKWAERRKALEVVTDPSHNPAKALAQKSQMALDELDFQAEKSQWLARQVKDANKTMSQLEEKFDSSKAISLAELSERETTLHKLNNRMRLTIGMDSQGSGNLVINGVAIMGHGGRQITKTLKDSPPIEAEVIDE